MANDQKTRAALTICLSRDLESESNGIEFEVIKNDEILPAFAIRFRGVVYAYVNRCSHMQLKLNFINDNFFDFDREHLICATHGALYDVKSGACRDGPCNGLGLVPLSVTELEGRVTLSDNTGVTLLKEDP